MPVLLFNASQSIYFRDGSRGRVQGVRSPPEMTCGFLIQLVFCEEKKTMWFIGVEVEQETSAPPPEKNPGSAPVFLTLKPRAFRYSGTPPYGHVVNIFFGRHAKTSISVFSCKETLVNTTTTTTTTSLFSITILYKCYRLK